MKYPPAWVLLTTAAAVALAAAVVLGLLIVTLLQGAHVLLELIARSLGG